MEILILFSKNSSGHRKMKNTEAGMINRHYEVDCGNEKYMTLDSKGKDRRKGG